MTQNAYHPPAHPLEVLAKISFDEALEPDDPRRVDTQTARGSQKTLDRLARKFGLLLDSGRFVPPAQKHVLFFGHVGSGKTTELKFYARELKRSKRFFSVDVDVSVDLDRNNLQYADLLMAMSRALLARLQAVGANLPKDAFKALEDWFAETVSSHAEIKDFAAEIQAGVSAKHGIPFLAELFGRFSVAFRTNATYKEELRRVIRNRFSDFSEAFNRLINRAHEVLRDKAGMDGVRILFFIDGTDKLRDEDTKRLFISDVELLLSVNTFAVYAAPITLKSHDGLTGKLDTTLTLPMIKLSNREGTVCQEGRAALRAILLKRADKSLFASDAVVESLVDYCGGHPRELLRLLGLCCEFADDKIDAVVVGQAVKQLASEYRYKLKTTDYPLLVAVDRDNADVGNDDALRNLLINLALLEYNDGSWRRSHPVIRTLEGYLRAEQSSTSS